MDWKAILDPDSPLWIPAVSGFAVGALITAVIAGIVIARLRTRIAIAETERKGQQAVEEERRAALERAEAQLGSTFSDLARQSLQSNSETFLTLAKEHLGRHEQKAQGDLE
ncbi:MAG: hypothetical protein OES37_06110, partial [Chromatiales bacterium]|nr:hypothetical protein [Chromatiales bacterium]